MLDQKRITFHLYHTNGIGYRKDNGGNFVSDPTKSVDTDSFGVGEGVIQITDESDKVTQTLNVESIEYHKRLYFPCEATIRMTATESNPSTLAKDVKAYFKNRPIDIVDKKDNVYIYIARNYYVESVKAEITSKRTVIIKCKSLDALLDIKPFCRTYQGAFATEIFSKVISDVKEKLTLREKPVEASQLCHLSYQKGTETHELHQPYLVQYNETFHTFARRIAYRCGEMLYFEGGKWNIGLSDATRAILANQETALPLEVSGNIESIDTCVDESPIDIEMFSSDYTSPSTEADKTSYRYHTAITADEYMHGLKPSDRCKASDGYNAARLVVKMLSGFFTGATYIDSLSNLAKESVVDLLFWYFPGLGLNSTYKEEFEKLLKAEKDNKLQPSDISSSDKTKNLFNAFYDLVSTNERQAKNSEISLTYSGTSYNVGLGDAVKISDSTHTPYNPHTPYIITELSGVVKLQGIEKTLVAEHSLKAVPGDAQTDKIYPPYTPEIETVRKTGPLQAKVIDNADPLRMNRVRVKYPWDSGAKNSPWIRVAQPYVEESIGGFNFMLQPGSVVMLDYEDGNIECPYVDGSVPWKPRQTFRGEPSLDKNYNLADIQNLLIGHNGQYIKFTDNLHQYANSNAAGTFVSNLIPPLGLMMNSVNAIAKKMGKTFEIGEGDQRWKGGIEIGDALGIYRIKGSTDKREITIESPCGTVSINAFTGITINAPNGDIRLVGKNITLEAGNNVTIKSGTNITTYSENEADTSRYATKTELVGGIASSVGAAVAKSFVDTKVMRDLVGMPIDTAKILDVSFVRSTWECLMRPVEGTSTLKSKRNMRIEVGDGKAIIPTSRLATTKDDLTNSSGASIVEKAQKAEQALQESQQTELLKNVLRYLEIYVYQCIEEISNRHTTEYNLINALQNRITTDEWTTLDGDWAEWNTPIKVLKKISAGQALPDYQAAPAPQKDVLQKLSPIIAEANLLHPLIAEDFHTAYMEGINGCLKKTKGAKDIEAKIKETATKLKDRIVDLQDNLFNHLEDNDTLADLKIRDTIIAQQQTDMHRQLLYEAATQWTDLFEVMKRKPDNPDEWEEVTLGQADYSDAPSWQTFYENLRPKLSHDNGGFFTNLLAGVSHLGTDLATNFAGPAGNRFGLASWKTLLNRHGEAGPRAYSDIAQNGGTLVISNTQNKTLELSESGTQWQDNENPFRETFLSYIRTQSLNSIMGISLRF